MPQNTSSSSLFGRISTSTRSSFMSSKEVRCNIHLLHDSDIIANEFPRSQPAQTVLDYVCNMKNIQEKDFLGLRYQDHNKHRYWLDLSRSLSHVVKQFRTESLSLHLRFRYYPSDPARIRDLNLRYQLFVQLQRDLLHGRLYCPQTHAAELAALILQAQLGDFDENEHIGNYVSGYKLLLRQTPKLEERIASLHKSYKGKSASDAELEFLEKASQLDTYAFDPYTIKDPQDNSNAVYIGASAKGILIYTGTSRAHHIDWSELTKVDYSGRELRISVSDTYQPPSSAKIANGGTLEKSSNGGSPISGTSSNDKNASKKGAQTLKYICPSGQFAKHLWIHILSQQAFFNENSAQDVKLKFSKPRIPLLSRGSTFRFPSRRVYREIEDGFSSGNESRIGVQSMTNGNLLHDQTTDNESAFNTSTMSVPVIRYELPRQEVRKDEPWLSKSASSSAKTSIAGKGATHFEHTTEGSSSDQENNNYSKAKSTNLNISFAPDVIRHDETPSTSEEIVPPPTFISTVKSSDQNSTSFTVHLVKREASRSQSPISSAATDFSDFEDFEKNNNSRAEVLEQEFVENIENEVSPGAPLASSTPRTVKNTVGNGNGKLLGNGNNDRKVLTNGLSSSMPTTSESDTSSVSDKHQRSVLSRITNSLFVFFLMFILTLAVIICVFEKSETSTSDWIENQKHLSQFRHVYYDPARHYVIDQYRKYFGAKY